MESNITAFTSAIAPSIHWTLPPTLSTTLTVTTPTLGQHRRPKFFDDALLQDGLDPVLMLKNFFLRELEHLSLQSLLSFVQCLRVRQGAYLKR